MLLRARSADLVGILNGIDTKEWDAASDPHIPKPYSADDLSGKTEAKAAVLRRYGLPADRTALKRPLIGMVSRMVDQKGLDLIAALETDLPALDSLNDRAAVSRQLGLVEHVYSKVEWERSHHLRCGVGWQLLERLGDVGRPQFAERLLELLGIAVHQVE